MSRKQKTSVLQAELQGAIGKHQLSNREELMSFMEDGLGLNITRVNKTSISVRFPGDKQAIKLKGAMFEPQTNLENFGSKNSKLRTTEEHKQAVQDLSEQIPMHSLQK